MDQPEITRVNPKFEILCDPWPCSVVTERPCWGRFLPTSGLQTPTWDLPKG